MKASHQINLGTMIAPHYVRWKTHAPEAPGIELMTDDNIIVGFVPWADLKEELDDQLLPSAFADPRGYHFELQDHHGKKDWLMKIVDSDDQAFCNVWLGVNPDQGWEHDGMIHLGGDDSPHVWQSYQRYSDGRYRRLKSAYRTLEVAKNEG